MKINTAGKMGKGDSYVAPDPHFVSVVLLFSNSLPWSKFEKFFNTKKLVNISASDQITLLRLIALQELLCLDDEGLLKWSKNQLSLFSFMQLDFTPKLPTKALLVEFRQKFDEIGLLTPFRKQCQRLIGEHDKMFPPIITADKSSKTSSSEASSFKLEQRKANDIKVDLPNVPNLASGTCPSCGSHNIVQLTPSQEASTLPNISFSRCRFCGNTFRD